MIPLLSSTLTDPFGTSHPELLLVAVQATKMVIINCWPRMTESMYRIEFIKSLTLCWTAIQEDARPSDMSHQKCLEVVQEELKMTAAILVKSVNHQLNMKDELDPVLHASSNLSSLFGMVEEAV